VNVVLKEVNFSTYQVITGSAQSDEHDLVDSVKGYTKTSYLQLHILFTFDNLEGKEEIGCVDSKYCEIGRVVYDSNGNCGAPVMQSIPSVSTILSDAQSLAEAKAVSLNNEYLFGRDTEAYLRKCEQLNNLPSRYSETGYQILNN
jgi:hypothetical protein